MLFHFLKEKYGFDITWSTYASEGGNFGFFTSHETMKRLNSKMYAEAKRLGFKGFSAASAAICGGSSTSIWTPSTAQPTFWRCRFSHYRDPF